jgi:hypothetical protein
MMCGVNFPNIFCSTSAISAALAFSLIQFPTSQSRLSRKLLLVLFGEKWWRGEGEVKVIVYPFHNSYLSLPEFFFFFLEKFSLQTDYCGG